MLPQQLLDRLPLYSVIVTTAMAAVVITAFVIVYARHTWEKTKPGRIIMAFAVSIMLRAWVALLSRFDDYHEEIDLSFITWPLISVAWLVLTAVFTWCIVDIIRSERDMSMTEFNKRKPDVRNAVPTSPLPGEDPVDIHGPEVNVPQYPFPITDADDIQEDPTHGHP